MTRRNPWPQESNKKLGPQSRHGSLAVPNSMVGYHAMVVGHGSRNHWHFAIINQLISDHRDIISDAHILDIVDYFP